MTWEQIKPSWCLVFYYILGLYNVLCWSAIRKKSCCFVICQEHYVRDNVRRTAHCCEINQGDAKTPVSGGVPSPWTGSSHNNDPFAELYPAHFTTTYLGNSNSLFYLAMVYYRGIADGRMWMESSIQQCCVKKKKKKYYLTCACLSQPLPTYY